MKNQRFVHVKCNNNTICYLPADDSICSPAANSANTAVATRIYKNSLNNNKIRLYANALCPFLCCLYS